MRSRIVLLLFTILAMTVPSLLPHREGPAFIMVGSGSGGLRLHVWRDRGASLFYGALLGLEVRPGVFDIDEVYAGLYSRLTDPYACRQDTSRQTYDRVLLDFEDGSREEEYCTHDSAFAIRVLIRACENLTESPWHTTGDVYDRACGELTGRAP